MAHLFELARGQPYGNGRVNIGFGFDYWFLPKEAVTGIFSSLRGAGIKLFTSHYAKNATFGTCSASQRPDRKHEGGLSLTSDSRRKSSDSYPGGIRATEIA